MEPDPSMLKAARRHDHPRLAFVRASAEELEGVVDQGSVDKVPSRAMLHWLPVASYLGVFASIFPILRPGGWFHSESAGAGNVPQMVAVVDDLAVRFGVAMPPRFPDTGVAFNMVEQAGFMIRKRGSGPSDNVVRSPASRPSAFSEHKELSLLHGWLIRAIKNQSRTLPWPNWTGCVARTGRSTKPSPVSRSWRNDLLDRPFQSEGSRRPGTRPPLRQSRSSHSRVIYRLAINSPTFDTVRYRLMIRGP